MPRIPRIYIEGALYYITNRSIPGENIFKEKEDYEMYIELLEKYKQQHGYKLFSFVLMPAHIHLLLEAGPDANISDIMHNITSAYTKNYNKKYSRKGHLFRGRYRATIVEKEPYLLKLTRYIHRNPLKSRLTTSLQDYPWSSFVFYNMNLDSPIVNKVDMRQEVSEALSLLKDQGYEEYLRDVDEDEDNKFHKALHRRFYLGSEEFGRLIRKKIDESAKIEVKKTSRLPQRVLLLVVVFTFTIVALGVFLDKLMPLITSVVLPEKQDQKTQIAAPSEEEIQQVIPFDQVGLDSTIWQVKFVAGTPFQALDMLHFREGKMYSENLQLNGYRASNYSMTKQSGRVIWETMQTSETGTASWRGEIEAGQMRGVLSLRRSDKEPQDFSFVSIKYHYEGVKP